jgi:hypothetical protein
MAVADLATQLTLFEHSFVRAMTPQALLAWRVEHLELLDVNCTTTQHNTTL